MTTAPRSLLRSLATSLALALCASSAAGCGDAEDADAPVSSTGRASDRIELRATLTDEGGGAISARATLRVPAGGAAANDAGRTIQLDGGDVLRVGGVAMALGTSGSYEASLPAAPRASVDVALEGPSRAGATSFTAVFPAPFDLTGPEAGATVLASEGVRFQWSAPFDKATTRQFLVQGDCLVDDFSFPVGLAGDATSHTMAPLRMRSGQEQGSCDATLSIIVASGSEPTGFAASSVATTQQRRTVRVRVVP